MSLFYCAGADATLAGSAVGGRFLEVTIYITAMESSPGIIVNKWMHLQVGIIRISFSAVWADLSAVCIDLFGIMCPGILLSGFFCTWLYTASEKPNLLFKRGRSVHIMNVNVNKRGEITWAELNTNDVSSTCRPKKDYSRLHLVHRLGDFYEIVF